MTHEQVDSKSVNKRKPKFNKQNNETKKKQNFMSSATIKGC
jgi:hypothetical protein